MWVCSDSDGDSDSDSGSFSVVQKVDVTSKAVVEVISKTSEYLQPNPGETHHLPLPMILSGRLPWVPVGHTPYSEGSTHVKDLCQVHTYCRNVVQIYISLYLFPHSSLLPFRSPATRSSPSTRTLTSIPALKASSQEILSAQTEERSEEKGDALGAARSLASLNGQGMVHWSTVQYITHAHTHALSRR